MRGAAALRAALALAGTAAAAELAPLSDGGGPGAYRANVVRCAALSLTLRQDLLADGSPRSLDLAAASEARADYFLLLLLEHIGTKRGTPPDADEMLALVEPPGAEYARLMDAARAATGDRFSDPVVSGDLAFCENLYVPGH